MWGRAVVILTDAEKADLMTTAAELADAARVATLLHFRSDDLTADNKDAQRFDPVTVADRLSETRMREILALLGKSARAASWRVGGS